MSQLFKEVIHDIQEKWECTDLTCMFRSDGYEDYRLSLMILPSCMQITIRQLSSETIAVSLNETRIGTIARVTHHRVSEFSGAFVIDTIQQWYPNLHDHYMSSILEYLNDEGMPLDTESLSEAAEIPEELAERLLNAYYDNDPTPRIVEIWKGDTIQRSGPRQYLTQSSAMEVVRSGFPVDPCYGFFKLQDGSLSPFIHLPRHQIRDKDENIVDNYLKRGRFYNKFFLAPMHLPLNKCEGVEPIHGLGDNGSYHVFDPIVDVSVFNTTRLFQLADRQVKHAYYPDKGKHATDQLQGTLGLYRLEPSMVIPLIQIPTVSVQDQLPEMMHDQPYTYVMINVTTFDHMTSIPSSAWPLLLEHNDI